MSEEETRAPLRLTRSVVAWAMVFAGLTSCTAGVWHLVGPAWAALVAGVPVSVLGLLAVDVGGSEPDGQSADPGQ